MTDHLTSELPKVRSSERSLMFSLSTPQKGLAFPQDNLEDYIWPGHPRQALEFWRYPSHTKCTNRHLDNINGSRTLNKPKVNERTLCFHCLSFALSIPMWLSLLRGLIIITAHYNQFNRIRWLTVSFCDFPLGDLSPHHLNLLGSSKGF